MPAMYSHTTRWTGRSAACCEYVSGSRSGCAVKKANRSAIIAIERSRSAASSGEE